MDNVHRELRRLIIREDKIGKIKDRRPRIGK